MKRIFCLVLMICLFLSFVPFRCLATQEDEERIVTYFEDGSYLAEKIYVSKVRASGVKTASKESVYYDNNGSAEWKAVLTGTFSYTGSSAVCTASSCSVTIYDSSWYTISKSATKSSNSAFASVTMGYKAFGVTVNQVPVSITLTCDKNGNLS